MNAFLPALGRRPRMSRLLLACSLVLVAVATPKAQPGDGTPTKLTLQPAGLPSPVLRYRLLPDLREQKPGNAATHYKHAMELFKKEQPNGNEASAERIDRWLSHTLLADL